MTFRERIADWISGGALTHEIWVRKRLTDLAGVLTDLAKERADQLDRIAAEEKPTSNATVRRMARIARGEE